MLAKRQHSIDVRTIRTNYKQIAVYIHFVNVLYKHFYEQLLAYKS